MPSQIKIFLFFLLLILLSSSDVVDGVKDGRKSTHNVQEVIIQPMKTRKLLVVNTVMDYDYGGPNPKHGKGKPGGGGAKSP